MDTGVSGALFDNGAFEEMMSRYYDDNINASGWWSESQWAASDFSVPVAGFVSQELFDGITEETLNFRGDVYAFSDVISYAGRYAVFCYTETTIIRICFRLPWWSWKKLTESGKS